MIANVVKTLLDEKDFVAFVEFVCEQETWLILTILKTIEEINHEAQILIVFKGVVWEWKIIA